MVITMLEASLSEDQAALLSESFEVGASPLPPAIRESYLLREIEGDRSRIVTVWESQEALAEYRASIETPGGVLMFRSAGAEPTLSIFRVASHATTH